jgi:hypothetical protein
MGKPVEKQGHKAAGLSASALMIVGLPCEDSISKPALLAAGFWF